jgi:hypothetical protein
MVSIFRVFREHRSDLGSFLSRTLYPIHVLGFLIPKKMSLERKQIFRPSYGVAVRSLVEICIDDISAILRATDLRFRLPFVSWAELMHLILRILKF